jgi:hypothetical protein
MGRRRFTSAASAASVASEFLAPPTRSIHAPASERKSEFASIEYSRSGRIETLRGERFGGRQNVRLKAGSYAGGETQITRSTLVDVGIDA